MRMLVLAVVVGISGCAHTYNKPGASQSDYDQAYTDCEVKMNQAGIERSQGMGIKNGFMDRCMSGRGFHVAE